MSTSFLPVLPDVVMIQRALALWYHDYTECMQLVFGDGSAVKLSLLDPLR